MESQKKIVSKKTVRFLPCVLAYTIQHVNEFTNDETRQLWYQEDEIKVIKADCYDTAAMVAENRTINESTQCFRGLEFRTPQGHKRRMRNKLCAIDAVLDEQEYQWTRHEDDAVLLASIYSEYTVASASAAHRLALEDEQEARMVYHQTLIPQTSDIKKVPCRSGLIKSRPIMFHPSIACGNSMLRR